MSVQASAWVIEHSRHKGSELLVLLMIANHAHADGTNAFPSVETLARECRMSARQITRIVRTVETSGELHIDRSAGRYSNRYALPLMNPDNLSGSNPDITVVPTLTNPDTNPDISGTNPDIAMSPEPSLEPKEELEELHSSKKQKSVATPPRTSDKKSRALSDSKPVLTKDPLLLNFAVVVYRDFCRLTPNHEQRKAIAEAITDPTLWATVCEAFMREGRPPNRVDWLLERYAKARAGPPRASFTPPTETFEEKQARLQAYFYGKGSHAAQQP